ncbi:phosphate signaling complex protein PhoU [Nocardioides alcanivorans]|uniref:phosphate signaling complex protein PhoU n=1 Tax=Nocardioides alcanivorans TaxID=2897352 RepID=UPI001F1A2422|nr:phosphate signaling complex protein PhoU [Nocardioides alcanivorans]
MREAYTDQLDSLFASLGSMAAEVKVAVASATQALLSGNGELADGVIAGDESIDRQREAIEDTAFSLLSLQQPVASDLRTVVAALRMVAEIERMGDLAVHVAKVARLRVPGVAVPRDVVPTIEQMAEVAKEMCRVLVRVIAERDVEAARELDEADDTMDQLRRNNFRELLSADWSHGVEPAVDLALLGRYYERIADHAVSVARRVIFVVTGEEHHES